GIADYVSPSKVLDDSPELGAECRSVGRKVGLSAGLHRQPLQNLAIEVRPKADGKDRGANFPPKRDDFLETVDASGRRAGVVLVTSVGQHDNGTPSLDVA